MRISIKSHQGCVGQFGTITIPVLVLIDIFCIILPIKENDGNA